MDRFLSSFRNRVDGKGRVSIPAAYRSILALGGTDEVFVYPALDAPALDCGGRRLVEEVYALLERLPPYSDERDFLSLALFGDCDPLRIDGDGRIVLSEALRAHAGIDGEVVIVGVGEKFQMWEPGRFAARRAEARDKVRELRRLLGNGAAMAAPADEARER